jgi:Fe-S-cluster-containing hydrogenase component 2
MSLKINKEKCGSIEKCPANAECIAVCNPKALVSEENYPKVLDKLCTECRDCIPVCPHSALTIV